MTPEDVTRAVSLARQTLTAATHEDWTATTAEGLTWTCWETAEHMADDLFAYASQLAPPA